MRYARLWAQSLALVLAASIAAAADIVVMKSGRSFEGVVVSESATSVIIQQQGASFSLPKSGIQEIRRAQVEKPAVGLPDLDAVLTAARTLEFSGELRQIPATVIDTGVLRNVPYLSYRIGEDVEVNIYGDPDRPGGIEIGLYSALLASSDAKATCLRFIAALVRADDIRSISLDGGSLDLGDVSLEVTLPDAPDAYGGWWVSAYDEAILGLSRVSERELAAISIETRVAQEAARRAEQEARTQDALAWTAAELRRARATQAMASATPEVTATRQTVSTRPTASSSGRVWVSGYYRKDGTYVRGHSRRKSH